MADSDVLPNIWALRWGDVDWEKARLTITSPKTEHHAGGGSRIIPIFAELRTHLEAVWDAAPEGGEFVITRYRTSNSNLRTQLLRIIKRAGLNPWPRLFHNLRATRQTELAAHFPVHVVCEWLGNSKLIAQEHYLRVTEADYDWANKAACSALHNPVQSGAAEPRNEPQPVNSPNKKTPDLQGLATPCGVQK